MLDLSDHQIATISMWAEIAILLFMVWEKYGPPLLWGPAMSVSHKPNQGILAFFIENRTLIFAVIGLLIVAWLNMRGGQLETPAIALIVGSSLLAGGVIGATVRELFSWHGNRRLSSKQIRTLIAEFSKAKPDIPRIIFAHFADE